MLFNHAMSILFLTSMTTKCRKPPAQVTPLGTLRSGRELLMSKATDADVTVAGIALAMAVSQAAAFLDVADVDV